MRKKAVRPTHSRKASFPFREICEELSMAGMTLLKMPIMGVGSSLLLALD